MAEDKRKSILDAEEKETLKKLRQVEVCVSNHIRESKRQLIGTRYYKKFTVPTGQFSFDFENLFITIEQEENGKITYHFRILNEEKGILDERLVVEQDGKVYTMKELEKIFGNTEMNIEELINQNDRIQGQLKGTSYNVSPEQARKLLTGRNEESKDNENDEKSQQMEADLSEQGKEVKIGRHKGIKDDQISKIMPEAFDQNTEYEIAEDRTTGKCIIVSKNQEGKYQINENIEPGRMTIKKVISMGPEGKENESEIPDQLMSVKGNPRQEVAASINDWGELYIETIHVTPDQIRIGSSVQMENQGHEAQTQKGVRDQIKQEGGPNFLDEIAHKRQILKEEYGVTEASNEYLKKLDIESLMEEEAERVKVSKYAFKGYVKNAQGKTLEEKINNAQEEIIKEYKGNRRPR